MTLNLPDCLPFREMTSFYYPCHVGLMMSERTLKSCHPTAAVLLDALAEDVEPMPGLLWSFEYTRENWPRLCSALGEMFPNDDDDLDFFIDDAIEPTKPGFPGPHREGGAF